MRHLLERLEGVAHPSEVTLAARHLRAQLVHLLVHLVRGLALAGDVELRLERLDVRRALLEVEARRLERRLRVGELAHELVDPLVLLE